jgi:hypothetical protein
MQNNPREALVSMSPELFEDLMTTIHQLTAYLEQIPLENEEEVKLYSLGFQATLYLSWFIDAYFEREGYKNAGKDQEAAS